MHLDYGDKFAIIIYPPGSQRYIERMDELDHNMFYFQVRGKYFK
jgi:hypothetical protein